MAKTSERGKSVTSYPTLGPDDYLSDELPDYSSRRSSFYGGDCKPNPFDPESDRSRRISTASNMLEVPGYSFYERQNSLGSTTSLVSDVSNNSNNTFSYRNLNKPKIKNAFGSLIVLIGLCLLVLGILFLIFGHKTDLMPSNMNDQKYNPDINYNNNSSTNNSKSNVTTTPISDINNNNQNKNGYHVSAIETIGYFALFSGILLILIGISIICMSVKEVKKPNPSPQNPIRDFKRRVSTIEVESLPQITSNGLSVNKPEIMITTDNNLKDKVTYTKYPVPMPVPEPIPRPGISTEDMYSPRSPNEYKKFQF